MPYNLAINRKIADILYLCILKQDTVHRMSNVKIKERIDGNPKWSTFRVGGFIAD